MGKRILITGGAGFIFSRFAEHCVNAGYDVAVVDSLTYAGDLDRLNKINGNYRFYKADVNSRQSIDDILKIEKPKIIVHSAAESHVDRSIMDSTPFIDTNVRGTQVMLDAARQIEVGLFVNISTDEVYGELGSDGHFYETTPLNPNSPYSVSKTSADMLGSAYYRTYQLPVITVRPSNNYGPFQYPEKLIPVVFLKALHNEKVPVYGEGLNIREWLYVDDTVEAIEQIILKGNPGEAYNIGSGKERTNISVVKSILDIMDKPHSLIEFVKDRPGHDFRYSLNCDKIINQTNWQRKYDFEKGIEKTIKWYIDNKQWAINKLEKLRNYWKQAYA